MDKIGNKIYELRKQRGLSQEELAYKLGVARQTISKWELGDATPDFKNLLALSEFFNVDIKYFTGADNDKFESTALTVSTGSTKNKKLLIFLKIFLFVLVVLTIIIGIILSMFIKIICSSEEMVENVIFMFVNTSSTETLIFLICGFIFLIILIILISIILHKMRK